MFVSDFYNFQKVKEFFGEMSKLKEEIKIISTEKGETFTFPFYVTKPSLLTFPTDEKNHFKWKGRIPKRVSSSFIGLFCSFQQLARVKIIWKCLETGEIGVTQSEIIFKVICNPKYKNSSIVLGVLKDAKISEKDFDEIFPDDLIIKNSVEDSKKLLEEIKYADESESEDEDFDVDEIVRSIVENDCGYNRSLSVEIADAAVAADGVDKNLSIGTVYLSKTFIQPGTQIFITIEIDLKLISKIDLIKLKLECYEIYPIEFVVKDVEKIWRDTVKEIKISPGFQDRLEIIFPISPELTSSITSKLFNLKWELIINFKIKNEDFDLRIPLNFISFKFQLNKK